MTTFAFGAFSSAMLAQVSTHYGWSANDWNDWTGIGISIFGTVFFAALSFIERFEVRRRCA